MKKTLRKLTLSRETLRRLETPVLHHSGGAGRPHPPLTPTCLTECYCSLSCPVACTTM